MTWFLIADEVITGFGRTGEYFAPMNWDVTPDYHDGCKVVDERLFAFGGDDCDEEDRGCVLWAVRMRRSGTW